MGSIRSSSEPLLVAQDTDLAVKKCPDKRKVLRERGETDKARQNAINKQENAHPFSRGIETNTNPPDDHWTGKSGINHTV